MDILERFIGSLSSDEVRRFKILSNRFKRDDEKKMLILFDALRNHDENGNQDEIVLSLYGNKDSKVMNRYYRLRNKLHSNLEKALLFYHFNPKSQNQTQNLIQLARLMKERGLYQEAGHYLQKAEKAATNHGLFNELELIFEDMVQLASRNVQIDIDRVIEKRRENLRRIEIQRATNEMLGIIAQKANRMNLSRGKQAGSILEMLEGTRDRLEAYKDLFDSPAGKIAIYRIVSAIFLRKGAYKELETYIHDTFQQFQEENIFNRNTHSLRLLMRIWWLNVHTRLLQLEKAEEQLGHLWHDLKQFEKQNFNEYAIHYYRMKVIMTKMKGDIDIVGKTIKEALAQPSIMENDLNELYMLISLMDYHFIQGDYLKAIETCKKLTRHKQYQILDEEFRLYAKIFEVVALIEAGKHDGAQQMVGEIRKIFRNQLKDDEFRREAKFLQILLRISKGATTDLNVNLLEAYKQFTAAYPPSEVGGNEIIMYEYYLKSKLEERPYYEIYCQETARAIS